MLPRHSYATCPVPLDAVEFDWLDESTYANPFSRTSESSRSITRIYLVAPTSTTDCLPPMKAFIDYARKEHNVKRFVLLSSSALPEGGPAMGRVHAYLKEIGKEGVEWCVLRPSWFMDNFANDRAGLIRDEDRVVSATGTGKIPFVAADDIAQAAFDALTATTSVDSDLFVVGPELLSYDEAASRLTTLLDRPITHTKLSFDEHVDFAASTFLPNREYAQVLTALDIKISEGLEQKVFESEEHRGNRFVGKVRFNDWAAKQNMSVWKKA